MPVAAILLPGGVLPADLAYGDLLAALGEREITAVAKDLELYAGNESPPGYELGTEVEGVLQMAEDLGFERFHLVGYSAGGASAVLTTARHPDRVLSLALLEPAWFGNEGRSPEEVAAWEQVLEATNLPPDEAMAAFVAGQLAPGVEPPPPPPGGPPPWMAKRPAGLRALTTAFAAEQLDLESLSNYDRPVYFALGAKSNPDYYGEIAKRAERVFADFTLELFEERHHFDPPHRVEPERLANSLLAVWERAGS